MLNVRFFAYLREKLDCDKLNLPDCKDIKALKELIYHQHPEWKNELEQSNIMIAVNHALIQGNIPLQAGDEIAFLPPMTGG